MFAPFVSKTVFLKAFPASSHFILLVRTASHGHPSCKGDWEPRDEDDLSPRLGTRGSE